MDEYSNQFLLIAANANISDKEQVPYFQRGLDPKVMDKIYDKETLPKDTIQDWVNMACKVDEHMRAQNAILANSTSFQSDFLNCFHLQSISHYTSSNAPCRMANQVVDIDINMSRKQSADHQKHTYSGKPPSPCYNCGKTGHWNSDCPSSPMEDEDNKGPTLGNQAGVRRGVVEEQNGLQGIRR